MLNVRGIKARPRDIYEMMLHKPTLVELHCSVDDLLWTPPCTYNVPLAVHLPEYDHGTLVDPACAREPERRAAQDLHVRAVRRAIEWAPSFDGGKPKIVFHPGGMGVNKFSTAQVQDARAQLDKTIEAMTDAAGDAADILVENVPRHCWFFGGEWFANLGAEIPQVVDICERHKIGMTLDLCHLYLAAQALRFSITAAVDQAKPYVQHLHYSGAHGIDGEGLAVDDPASTFDLAAAIGRLRDLDAVAVPEVWFGHENGGLGFVRAWEALELKTKTAYT